MGEERAVDVAVACFNVSASLSLSMVFIALSLSLFISHYPPPPFLSPCLSAAAAAPAVWIHNSVCSRACGLGSLSKQPGRKKNEETESRD